MNFTMKLVSSVLSSASTYMPALSHLEPTSTTLSDKEKLARFTILTASTIICVGGLLGSFCSMKKSAKQILIFWSFSAISLAVLKYQYNFLASIPLTSLNQT